MSPYWHVLNLGVQSTLVYRVNFLFRAVFGLVPVMATLYLWRAIYASRDGGPELAGYTLGSMTSYYLLVMIVDTLTAVTEDDWQIAADIREGRISQFLLKPIDYLSYRLCLYLSGRLIYTAVAFLPLLGFVLLQRQHLVLPPDATTAVLFVVSLGLTALLQFLLSFTMALLAFWVLEVSTFIFILFAFEYIAGGHLFPLDLLPPMLAQALSYTPFPYQLFFPVSIYLGQTTGPALAQGLALQVFWVATVYVLARVIWQRGLRHYSAFGG